MSEKNYSTADIQAVANGIRKQILGVALKTGGCYLAQACSSAEIIASLYTRVMNLGPSVGSWEPIPFPGVPGPDNMDYQRGSSYNGAPAPDKDRFFVSCCHYASVIYAALAETGRISPDCMDKFNVDGWEHGNDRCGALPGFENTAGCSARPSRSQAARLMPASAAATPASAMFCSVTVSCRKVRPGSAFRQPVTTSWIISSL